MVNFYNMKTTKAKLLLAITQYSEVIIWGPVKHGQGYWIPFYFDFRGLISIPKLRKIFVNALVDKIHKYKIDLILGAETAGISWAAMVAHELNKPCSYVRKAKKKSMTHRSTEGIFKAGTSAVLVDDTILFGQTKKLMIEAAGQEGLVVRRIVTLYSSNYKSVAGSAFAKWLKQKNITFEGLVTGQDLIKAFIKVGILNDQMMELRNMYLKDPYHWHKKIRARELLLELKRLKKRYG